MPREIMFQEYYLKVFTDIYRDATELLKNPPETFTAANWAKAEGVRQHALYQIAVHLGIPDLPSPCGLLSREQWQQCIDFMANHEVKPCL